MCDSQHPIIDYLKQDPRYKLDAYQFVRDALTYAQDELSMGGVERSTEPLDEEQDEIDDDIDDEIDDDIDEDEDDERHWETHLTGQQLCEAIRQLAQDQFGYMAKAVLNNWGVYRTSDFGEIVYNLIKIGVMKKSDTDRREDFDDVYEFEDAFLRGFRITKPE